MAYFGSVTKLSLTACLFAGVLCSAAVFGQSPVPAGGEIIVEAGKEIPIYGARSGCDAKKPPTFDQVMEKGLDNSPEHGELSDGGVGSRFSNRCEGDVPVRIISYISSQGYEGEDRVVIYGDTVEITVTSAQEEVSITVPAGGEVSVLAGETTPIYGARGDCNASSPPTFDRVMERGLETKPEHGELSDGGVGQRFSNKCKGEVPIRIISYTSTPNYEGEDTVVIYGDRVDVTVEAP